MEAKKSIEIPIGMVDMVASWRAQSSVVKLGHLLEAEKLAMVSCGKYYIQLGGKKTHTPPSKNSYKNSYKGMSFFATKLYSGDYSQ